MEGNKMSKKAMARVVYAGQYEVHCVVCGKQLGFYEKGFKGSGLTCSWCKRDLSFIVQDEETIVRCKHKKS